MTPKKKNSRWWKKKKGGGGTNHEWPQERKLWLTKQKRFSNQWKGLQCNGVAKRFRQLSSDWTNRRFFSHLACCTRHPAMTQSSSQSKWIEDDIYRIDRNQIVWWCRVASSGFYASLPVLRTLAQFGNLASILLAPMLLAVAPACAIINHATTLACEYQVNRKTSTSCTRITQFASLHPSSIRRPFCFCFLLLPR